MEKDWNELFRMGAKAGLLPLETLRLTCYLGINKWDDVGEWDDEALLKSGFVELSGGRKEATRDGLKVFRKIRRDTGGLSFKLRNMFPPGMKDDKWPWRGTPKAVMQRLDEFFKNYPDVTDDEVIEATKEYLTNFSSDTGRSLLVYFISKTLNGEERSILAEYVYAKREGTESKPKSSYDQI